MGWIAVFLLLFSLQVFAQPSIPMEWFYFPQDFSTLYGSVPIACTTNLISVPVGIFWGVDNALILDRTNLDPACLEYSVVDTNWVQNFTYDTGTVLFYFAPNWASVSQGGTGPGETAYFVAGGDWSSNSPDGLLAIYTDAYGSNIYFGAVSNGVSTNYASSPISWTSNTFHQIAVEWRSTGSWFTPGSKIYLDGALAATGSRVGIVPQLGADTNGFCTNGEYVGSDNIGGQQMRGAMWNLITWSVMYGGWYTEGWPYMSNALVTWQATLGGGGFGGMMGQPSGAMGQSGGPSNVIPATNYIDYNQFWVMTSLTNQTNVLVTVTNTLSNLTYTILTNSALGSNAPPFGIFATLTASNSFVVASNAIALGSSPLFVQAGLVWNTSTNNSPLPDWLSMSLYGRLSIPTVGGYITDGVAAYWKMNETNGSIAHDSSVNGLDLYLSNSPSWGSNYLILNGTSQYGDAGSNGFACLDTNDITIFAWISNTGNSTDVIASKWDTNNKAGWSFDVLSNGLLDMYVDGNADVMKNTGPSTVAGGQWTFVAVVWHNVPGNYTADFYFDGVLDSSKNSGEPSQTSSGSAHLVVGGVYEGTGGYFDGCMHDVAIYNRALTSWEIGFNFLSSEFITNVLDPDLLYYKMSESNQTSVPIHLANSSNPDGPTGLYASNASVIWTSGLRGQPDSALHFDGVSSYIDTGLAPPFDWLSAAFDFTTNLFTINLWVEPTSSYNHYLMQDQDSSGTNGWFLSLDGSYHVLFGTMSNEVPYSVSTTAKAQNWTWDMVSVVRTSLTNVIIYVNGSADVSGYFPCPNSSTNTLKIAIDPVETNIYDGNLWLIQVWTTNLSPSDIANLYYNQGRGIPWP